MSFADEQFLNDQFPVQRRKRTSMGCIIVIIFGVFMVLLTVCCGGAGFLAY